MNLRPAPNLQDFRNLDPRSRVAREDPCTVGVNLAGLPAIALPITLSLKEKLPIGLQLIGPAWSEPELISLAEKLEERASFTHLVNVADLLGVN